MPDNTTLKVRLKDPATSNYLYPATGLNAIYAGTSGDAATLSIIDGSSKIYARYLQIVDTTTNKVTSNYLPITFTNTGLIASASLGIFDGNGKISPDLLPSYVDDVVEIPVLTQAPPYPAGKLFILDNGDGTYNFYQKNANNEWVPGGGNAGTIYVDSDGDIFRAIAGAEYPDPDAAKISQSPYVIDQSVTSGVQLVLNNGTLSAQGVVATTQSAGVVKVSTANTNGAALTIAADGTLAATATVGDNTHPGTVVVAGTTADYNYAKTPAGGNHADSYIVPTVKFMYDYVDEYVPSVDFATTTNPGIVRIDPLGNINVGDSGLISVPNADANTAGVVKILNKINTTIDENALKAVTQAGIIDYVGSTLSGYQPSLTPGDGIDITERTISADIKAPIVFDGGKMTVQDASAASPGTVLITGDQAYISSGSSSLAGHPLAVNPKAVHDYVSSVISDIPVDVPIAKNDVRGGFKTSGTSTGLVMTSAANTQSADVLAINYATPLSINENNKLTALPASSGGIGVVKIRSMADAAASDDIYAVPQAYDVKHYIDVAIEGATYAAGSSIDPTQLAAGTIAVIQATYTSHGAARFNGPDSGFIVSDGIVSMGKATSNTLGGVQIGTGINVVDGVISVETGINAAAQYVTNKSTVDTPLGGVRIVSGSGIGLTEGTTAGNLYLQPATTASIGGVIVGDEQTGLSVTPEGAIKIHKKTDGPIDITNDNELTVIAASQDSAGVVKTTTYATDYNNFTNPNNVPTGTAVASFVAAKITSATAGLQEAIVPGEGLAFGNSDLTSNTLSVQYTGPLYISTSLVAPITSKLSVSAAVAGSQTVLNNNAFGAVWVRHKIRAASVIEDDSRVDATVPSEKAVRELVDAIPYITYEQLS